MEKLKPITITFNYGQNKYLKHFINALNINKIEFVKTKIYAANNRNYAIEINYNLKKAYKFMATYKTYKGKKLIKHT